MEVRNLISIFEHLAPALAYGGVHTSIVTLWNRCGGCVLCCAVLWHGAV